jgi:hypothetical protein
MLGILPHENPWPKTHKKNHYLKPNEVAGVDLVPSTGDWTHSKNRTSWSLSLEFGLSARGVWVCDGLRREKGKMERSYVHGEEERRKRENGEGLLCVVRERERGRKERKRKRKWKRVTCVGGEKCVVCWKCERIRWECVFTKVP